MAADVASPFSVEVNTNATGAGAFLLQACCESNQLVFYLLAKVQVLSTKLFTIKRSTLALLLALQHFEDKVGLGSSSVTMYTDHDPLVFLNQMYNSDQRLMC